MIQRLLRLNSAVYARMSQYSLKNLQKYTADKKILKTDSMEKVRSGTVKVTYILVPFKMVSDQANRNFMNRILK